MPVKVSMGGAIVQESVVADVWDTIVAYFAGVFGTTAFIIDVLSAAGVILASWLIIFVSRKVINKFLIVSSVDEQGQVVENKIALTVRILVQTLVNYAVYISAALAILHIFNIRVIDVDDVKLFVGRVIQAIIILVIAKAVLRVIRVLVDHWFAEERQPLVGKKRARTLSALTLSVMRYVVYFVAGIMVLQTFGVNTGSIIASAGIAGLAIGFGAQNLVKDVISGFFILFEDQFSVGEYVTVAGVTGTVEELGLRSTTIREWTGHVHTIPNGEIVQVKNYERNPILAVVAVNIAYEADIDEAIAVINKTLGKLFNEREDILEMPTVLGVEALSESSVDLKVTAKCRTGQQWAVEREMRKRIKQDLDAAGIPIPFPTRIVYHRSEGDVQQVVTETD